MADQNTLGIIYAILSGLVPASLWLWFWLRQDKEHPEPKGLIFLSFILGMAAVIFVLPAEKMANELILDEKTRLIAWAAIEEIAKYGAVSLLALHSKFLDEPLDYPIYFIVTAIGFAALENIIYVIEPLRNGEMVTGLITGNLRFLGATVLHINASALPGIALGLTFYSGWLSKKFMLLVGLSLSIVLHSVFNFFIMVDEGTNYITVFGFLWVVTIIIMLLFEKLRRMSGITVES